MMTLASRKQPSSDAEVYDLLQAMFGVGDWDEDLDGTPWHKARMREAAKIKAMRVKRKMTFADFTLVAEYCRRQRIYPTTVWAMLNHYGRAKLDALQQRKPSHLDEEIAAALANERSRPDVNQDWIGRLLRASGSGRQVVLDEWRAARG